MKKKPRVILASASPRRRELLHQLELNHEIFVPNVDETVGADESAEQYVCRVACYKTVIAWEYSQASSRLPVIAADTCISCHGEIIGKPRDAVDAMSILRKLSGRSHVVFSCVAMMGEVAGEEKQGARLNKSTVYFADLSDHDIQSYIATNEFSGKAGAYAIQGRAAVFISKIEGSYSGVMGLPLHETAELLRLFNIEVLEQQ